MKSLWKFKTAATVNLEATKYNPVQLLSILDTLARIIQIFVSPEKCANQCYEDLTPEG